MRPVSDAQVRKLMEELSKGGALGRAAMKAGMDRKTARKYVAVAKLPSELVRPRDWRTREDPFGKHWPEVEALLRDAPALEAKALFEELRTKYPGQYEEGQLRTLQRQVRRWRAARGPDKDIVLAQRHRPGEAAQTDFTWANELEVTVAGRVFAHVLCVFVLPFSNWRWATVCLSESMAALRRGVQRALFQLGRVPQYHQTDNSTAATHRIPDGKTVVLDAAGRRPFNESYAALMRHFGMTPRTTEVGAKEQNGDVEASNGVLKRQLLQALLLRGARDFDTVDAWQAFVDEVNRKANAARGERLVEELAAMRELAVSRLPEFVEETVRVSDWSTIRVKHCSYSVPSRLIGEHVLVRVHDDHLEVEFGGVQQLRCERLRGQHRHRIDYRHVVWSLVKKPGAFARYVYREEMFPTVMFRRAYDDIQSGRRGVAGDREYVRILHLAASTLETDVEAALELLLTEKRPVTYDAVRALVSKAPRHDAPALATQPVDLAAYDALLEEVGT